MRSIFHLLRADLECLGRVFALTAIASFVLFAVVNPCDAGRGWGLPYAGGVELDVKSDYSHIRIRRKNNVRTMVFVRDSGEEAMETQMDLNKPHELHFVYLRYMFLGYVFRPKQEKVLIVGLGGGSMVHFLKRYDPDVHIEAVEIDPVVVRIADKYFGVRSEGNVNVVTADGFEYLAKTESQYDVIYMDAFLKPSRGTDSTGVPLRLRTLRFYKDVQQKLKPGGLVVFNLNPHANMNNDVNTIRNAFPQAYVFPLPGDRGLVVAASMSPERLPLSEVHRRARELDRRFQASFSFQRMVRSVGR
jgi:spermidine synthase